MSDRHERQAAGTHPAPCARHCESTAYEIEIRRLRHDIEHHVRIAAEATQEAKQLRAELAASRHELEGAKKAANAQARIIESLQQQRAHLHAQRDQWIEARDTLDSERAANARLTEELAASREREARMRGALRNLLALDVDHQRGADDEDVCAEVREARAALAEGSQEPVHRPVHQPVHGELNNEA